MPYIVQSETQMNNIDVLYVHLYMDRKIVVANEVGCSVRAYVFVCVMRFLRF